MPSNGFAKNAFNLCLGPVHPALEEPIFFDFSVDGEKVVDAKLKSGNAHRGIEWLGMQRNPVQVIYLAERICGICSICHASTFCRAVEYAADIPVPDRAEYLRTIACEIERIHSHILWAGLLAHEMGFYSVLHYGMKVRENIMDLLEIFSGNRVHYCLFQIGGIRRDLTKEKLEKVKQSLKYYKEAYGKIVDIFLNDRTIRMRTEGVGILPKKYAVELCAVGPTARGSGVNRDVRQDWPYMAYGDIGITAQSPRTITGKINGDVQDRAIVRLLELKQSIDIIEACVDQMPSGDILSIPKTPALLAKLKQTQGEGIGRQEAPRGDLHHYVRLMQKPVIDTWKVKAPTYNNLQSVRTMVLNQQIADIPVIFCSIDPCISCTDRISVLKQGKGSNEITSSVITKDELHALSVKKTMSFGDIKQYKL